MIRKIKTFLFSLIYKFYLWTASGDTAAVGIPSRIAEYPFALKHLLKLPRGAAIAVLGCHGDNLTTIMSVLGYRVTGIDVKTFPYVHENFTFVEHDLRKLTSLKDASFDAVTAISTIEHVGMYDGDTDGDFSAANEAGRILKPGSLFVLTMPGARTSKFIELHERIYDQARMEKMLNNFTITDREFAAYRNGMWNKIAADMLPEPSDATSGLIMVAAMKKT